MFNFSFYLPSQNSSDLKKTLVTFQIYQKTLLTTYPVMLKNEDVVKYIFDSNRLRNILSKTDPFLENEIKIIHFSEALKKTVLKYLIETQTCPENSSMPQAYFMFNNFKTKTIQSSDFEQHYAVSIQLSSQGENIDQSENSEIMIIKVEPETM